MDSKQFEQIVVDRIDQSKDILCTKELEYSRACDRLHNFKRSGACQGKTPEDACVGMWMKHIISIIDMVQDIDHNQTHEKNIWDEKLNDAHNYLYLLEGLIHERYYNQEKI